jgi:hypothetical protein
MPWKEQPDGTRWLVTPSSLRHRARVLRQKANRAVARMDRERSGALPSPGVERNAQRGESSQKTGEAR